MANKIRDLSQISLLEVKSKEEKEDRMIFVTRINPKTPNMNSWFKKNWNILHSNYSNRELFKSTPMIAYKRQPTLRDIITTAKVEYPKKEIIKNKLYPAVCKKSPAKCTRCRYLENLLVYIAPTENFPTQDSNAHSQRG